MKIQEAVMKYLHYMQFDKQARPTTMKNRTKEMNKLIFRWFNMEVEDILGEHAEELKEEMQKRGCSPGYIRKILQTVRGFFRYLKEDLKLKVIETYEIKIPKQKKGPVSYLTMDEVKILFTYQPSNIFMYRLMAWVMLTLSSGTRSCESLGLLRTKIERQKFSFNEKKVEICFSNIEGKGGLSRKIFIQPWAMEWLQAYWSLRHDDDPSAFVNHCTNRAGEKIHAWRYEDLRYALKSLSKLVGRRITTHEIRRTASTLSHFNGLDVMDVKNFLGHQSLQYTDRYLGVNYSRLALQLHQFVKYDGMVAPQTPRKNNWAMLAGYDKCQGCGTTDRPHSAQGFCHRCYMNQWNHS